MAENVGTLYYDIQLDTAKMIDGQRKVDKELGKTTASLDRFAGRLTATAVAVAALAAAMYAIKAAKLADEFRLLGARVEVAAGSMESGAAAFDALVKISRATQSSLAGNIEVFTRLNQSILQMGGTQQDTLQMTELLAKAIKVSGASAVEAKSAMLQFGQALGSGKLAGDELRSLLENAPYLMRQLADGIGVPVGALKKLGEDGKLTADVIANALGKAAAQIDADFKKFPQTIESAMVVAQDAAALMALKFDELSGTSTVLTGVTKGLGETLDKLADQFGAANTQAGTLGRNTAIEGWAGRTRVALSYLIDAADLVWQTVSVLGRNVAYVFTGIGNEIGGIGAQVAAVMRGDFAQAKAIGDMMKADADKRRAELDAADARTLGRAKLAGQQMREAWEVGAGGGRGFVNPKAAASTLKPTTPPGKPKGAKFDSAAYLATLRKDQATEIGVINETEAEKLRIAQKHLAAKKISEAQYQQAVSLITQTAEQDRAELMRKTQEDIDKERLSAERKEAQERAELEANRLDARRDIAALDPIEAVRVEEEQRLAVVEAARQLDLQNTQLYEDQKLAIHRWAAEERRAILENQAQQQRRIQDMEFNAMADLAGNVYGLLQKSGREQSALGKAALLAQKAITVAQIIMSTNAAAAAALAPPPLGAGPIAGVGLATMIKASGYASAGLVAGMAIGEVAGGRQYGGPVAADSLYRVNERGPEMFMGSNGQQFMMPDRSGKVIPADQVGAGKAPTIIIQNMGTPQQVQSQSFDEQSNTLRLVTADLVGQIDSNSGPVFSALKRSTNVRGRM